MIFLSILILIVAIALPSIKISPILYVRLTSLIFIYAGVLAFNALYIQSIGSGIGIYSGLFQVSVLSQFVEAFLYFLASLILIAWPMSITNSNKKAAFSCDKHPNKNQSSKAGRVSSPKAEYSLIVLFSVLGGSLLVSSADVISMYLSIELQSFAVYLLATLYRDSDTSTSAGLKYFLLGGLSSCIILLGTGLIYSFTGLTNLESITSLISVNGLSNISQGLILGTVLVVVGFLFKISAAPLHNWSPDVYDDTPTIVTIWLTIMPKISIIIFLLLIQSHFNIFAFGLAYPDGLSVDPFFNSTDISTVLRNLLLITSSLSLIIGTVVGLAQSRIKRLLAYSTISHIGFILLALAISTEQAVDSLIFYVVQYSVTNLNTFLIILAFGYVRNNQDVKFINELRGQFFSNPLLSLSLSICLFSMAGVPPLLGFFSKQFVLYSAVQSGYYFMSILAIVLSVISASYYLKIIRVLHQGPAIGIVDGDEDEGDNFSVNTDSLTTYHSFLISTLTLGILLFAIRPSILLNSTQILSVSIFN